MASWVRLGAGVVVVAGLAGCVAAEVELVEGGAEGEAVGTLGSTTLDGVGNGDDDGDGASGHAEGSSGPWDPQRPGFLVAFDHATGPMQCDLFAQDCARGEKCMPWANDGGPAWNATRCSPLDPDPARLGQECRVEGTGVSGIDDCDIGLMCWNVDETGVGVCEDMCTGSALAPICEDSDDTCARANGGVIALCLPKCDPLLQDCAEGQACYPSFDAFVCAPAGRGDTGRHGDPCEYLNSCDPGFICIDPEAFAECSSGIGCCSSICALSDPAGDRWCDSRGAGQACEPWFREGTASAGYEDVGICALPR